MKGTLRQLSPRELKPWPDLNPRRRFDPEWLAELTASVREEGVLQPLLVHMPEGDWLAATGLIVAGETRWRAAMAAGVETVPCIVREYTLAEALKIALLENLQRKDLTAIEEARGFKRLLDETKCTQTDLADQVGKSQPYVANRIRLLELPDNVLELIDDGVLSPAIARDLLLPFARSPAEMRLMLFNSIAEWLVNPRNEEAVADQIRAAVGRFASGLSLPLTECIYSVDKGLPVFDPNFHKDCGCNAPKFRYGYQETFRCFDPEWWQARNEEAIATQKAEEDRAQKVASGTPARVTRFKDRAALDRKHGWNDRETLHDSYVYDPAILAAASFAMVDGEATLYCLDKKKVSSAQAAATRVVNKRLKDERAKIEAKILDEASKATAIDTDVIRFLLDRGHDRTDLSAVGKLMGIELSTYARTEEIAKIPPAKLIPFAKLLQLRSESGAWKQYQNPLEERIKAAVKREYSAAMNELLESIRSSAAEPTKTKPGARARRREKASSEVEEPVGV